MEGTTGPLHPKTIIIKSKRRNRHRKSDEMERQRNIFQMKEQDQTTARDQNKVDVSNMPDREFKVMIIKIVSRLEKKVENISETLSTQIKKEPIKIKNTISAIKNTLNGTNSRLDKVEE